MIVGADENAIVTQSRINVATHQTGHTIEFWGRYFKKSRFRTQGDSATSTSRAGRSTAQPARAPGSRAPARLDAIRSSRSIKWFVRPPALPQSIKVLAWQAVLECQNLDFSILNPAFDTATLGKFVLPTVPALAVVAASGNQRTRPKREKSEPRNRRRGAPRGRSAPRNRRRNTPRGKRDRERSGARPRFAQGNSGRCFSKKQEVANLVTF